ncbi:MAG: NDP-sugar synthase [Methanomassiliicoccaceae archaeon]|nr:NDP-sugar synthase [Methanomassiliicoccaceae archaeon]
MTKVRQAVVMTGGEGTRLMPLTKDCPKPILPVLDKPCIKYLLESMAGSGIEEVILACGSGTAQFEEALGDGSDMGIAIRYSCEDKKMGTAGAIKMLENRLDDVFVAANGDVLADISLGEQINKHFSCGAEVTISLTVVDNPSEYGIAEVDRENRITRFVEKPPREEAFSDLANAGVYVINKTVLSMVPEDEFFDFSKDLLPILMREGKRIQGFPLDGTWRDVGRPSDYLGANLSMASKLYDRTNWEGSRVESTVIRKPFYLGKNASVTGTDISAAVVMENAAVTDSKLTNAVIMKDSKISSARIESSTIGEGCRICPGAEIIRSTIGNGVTIEAGRKVADEKVSR